MFLHNLDAESTGKCVKEEGQFTRQERAPARSQTRPGALKPCDERPFIGSLSVKGHSSASSDKRWPGTYVM